MRNPNRKAAQRRQEDPKNSRAETIVLYHSKHGSTKQYAEWIAEALKADIMPYHKKKLGYISLYKNVVIGSKIRNGLLPGTMLIAENYENFSLRGKNLFLFAVGVAEEDPTYKRRLLEENRIEGIQDSNFWMLPGKIDMSSLSLSERALLKVSRVPSGAGIPQERIDEYNRRLDECFDGVTLEAIRPIVEAVLSVPQ